MREYTIKAVLPGNIAQPRYEGQVKVYAHTVDEAIDKAKARIRKTHGPREIRVTGVEVEV